MTGNWSPPVGAGTESSWFFFLVPSHPSVSLLCQCLGEVKSKYILCGVPPKTGEVVTLPALPIPMKVTLPGLRIPFQCRVRLAWKRQNNTVLPSLLVQLFSRLFVPLYH